MEKTSSNKKVSSILSNSVFQIGMVVLLSLAAFFIGSLWTKVQMLEKGTGKTAQKADTTATADKPSKPSVSLDNIKEVFDQAVIKFGDTKSKVIFLEISDPSCPYCHIAGGKNKELNAQTGQFKLVEDGGTYIAPVPEMKKLVDQGKASFALLYTPGHGAGEMAMKALYCAFEKGKFWEVNDLVMSNAGYDLINNTIKNDKAQAGALADFLAGAVNKNDMKTCLESGKYDAQLGKETSLASGIGVNGTPGFYINTTNFAGAYSFKDMESVVNAALGK